MPTLSEELTALKTEEDKITGNKVANFSYDDYAYTNNDANGVDSYNVNAHQNIPNGTASILKVNPTILTKGWRAQASAITRMLMNHFLGRTSYNLNKVNDHFSTLLTKLMAYLGSANGIATLDANGYVTESQIGLYRHIITVTYTVKYTAGMYVTGNEEYRTEIVEIVSNKSSIFTENEIISLIKGKTFINGIGYTRKHLASGNTGLEGLVEQYIGLSFSNEARPRGYYCKQHISKYIYDTPPEAVPEINWFIDMAHDVDIYAQSSSIPLITVEILNLTYTDTIA